VKRHKNFRHDFNTFREPFLLSSVEASWVALDDGHTMSSSDSASNAEVKKTGKGAAFWLTFFAVLLSTLLSALDMTAVGTALPTITEDLSGGNNYVWVGSAYALSSTAILPLSGRLADIFGRRPLMLSCIVLFALGSALAGAAQNMNMMIAARSEFKVLESVTWYSVIGNSHSGYRRWWHPKPFRDHCCRSCFAG